MRNKGRNADSWIVHLGLVVLASVLFAASFPNIIFIKGLPFLAWFAYIPILIVISKYGISACAGWGAFYGFTAYFLFNYWLGTFHPMAGTIVYSIYLVYMAAVFALLKTACVFFPNRGYILQWLIWLAYEYLRTTGFLGYPYGVTGYSQWQIIPLIQIASVTGVWGVSALVTFPSFWLAGAFQKDFTRRHGGTEDTEGREGREEFLPRTDTNGYEQNNKIKKCSCTNRRVVFVWFVVNNLNDFLKKEKIPAIIWAVSLVAALVFGFINMKDYSDYPSAQIALIQHNTDPWEASKLSEARQKIEAYRKDLQKLMRLSDEALAGDPKPQMVVWPETAFIPRIYWHTTHRDSRNSWLVVKELLDYLSKQDVPFLIGNDDARIDRAKNPDAEQMHRVDYNGALFFENGVNTQTYRKMHLVPFTEHFPYKKQFPKFHHWLENADTHFWEKGEEETVFNGPGFKFSSPICFEDSFGYLSRNFVRRGADVLVNMSNDAWSKSLPAQYQHLSMAVFRAVENKRSMVRSTSSGQTCAVDPSGRVTAEAAAFKETWLNVKAPLVKEVSLYTRFGDYAGIFFSASAVILLLYGALKCIIRNLIRSRKKGQKE